MNLPQGSSCTGAISRPRAISSARAAAASATTSWDALHRAGRRGGQPLAEGDRAGRSRRRQLHEADRVADRVVVVGMEADLLDIEGLGAIDVADRDDYELELPVHWNRLAADRCVCAPPEHKPVTERVRRGRKSGRPVAAASPPFGGMACGTGPYSPAIIASSAIRSRMRRRSLSLFSWPQAARMSRPRGVRIGEA